MSVNLDMLTEREHIFLDQFGDFLTTVSSCTSIIKFYKLKKITTEILNEARENEHEYPNLMIETPRDYYVFINYVIKNYGLHAVKASVIAVSIGWFIDYFNFSPEEGFDFVNDQFGINLIEIKEEVLSNLVEVREKTTDFFLSIF